MAAPCCPCRVLRWRSGLHACIEANLVAAGIEVLYDDRDERPGAKFAAADLVGIPWQLIAGPKGVAEGVVELKNRATGERQSVALDAALKAITT